MRTAFLAWLVIVLALSAFAGAEPAPARVTVEQLERELTAIRGEPDKRIALQLSSLELTERLSDLRRARLDADLPGPEARQALNTLADVSQFLDLPAADLPPIPVPDRATQVAMLTLTRDYVVKTIHKLPNFYATRETVNFEGAPAEAQGGALPSSKLESMPKTRFEPMHETSHSGVTVLYRGNKEMIAKDTEHGASAKQMQTAGEFGPILVTVVNDAAKGSVIWSHWELGASGLMAVFHFEVPERASHYLVGFSSVGQGDQREGNQNEGNQHDPAYHGEIAVNPADGSILRLTVVAQTIPGEPIEAANLAVVYGPVEIGGVTYICPVKSVAYSRTRKAVFEDIFNTGVAPFGSLGAPRDYLNEVLFTHYHLFRAETRILTGSGDEP
jgi:hypothetical protein